MNRSLPYSAIVNYDSTSALIYIYIYITSNYSRQHLNITKLIDQIIFEGLVSFLIINCILRTVHKKRNDRR